MTNVAITDKRGDLGDVGDVGDRGIVAEPMAPSPELDAANAAISAAFVKKQAAEKTAADASQAFDDAIRARDAIAEQIAASTAAKQAADKSEAATAAAKAAADQATATQAAAVAAQAKADAEAAAKVAAAATANVNSLVTHNTGK